MNIITIDARHRGKEQDKPLGFGEYFDKLVALPDFSFYFYGLSLSVILIVIGLPCLAIFCVKKVISSVF